MSDLGDIEGADVLYGDSVTLAAELGDVAATASALNCRAVIAQRRVRVRSAASLYARAKRLAAEAGDIRLFGMIEQNLGVLANIRGELETALQHYRAALAAFEEVRDDEAVSWVLNNLGMLQTDGGTPGWTTSGLTRGGRTRRARRDAEAAGMSESDLRWFRMGALLHDVGKVSVPLEILTKNGPLDDSEWAIMARHPEFGVELLDGIEFPWDVRPMIRHHHERFDGTGYPDVLCGRSIPFEARILTIADIYDALTTTRSYRAAFSHDKAMSILRSEMGTTVDPELFRLFEGQVVPRIPVVERAAAPQAVAV